MNHWFLLFVIMGIGLTAHGQIQVFLPATDSIGSYQPVETVRQIHIPDTLLETFKRDPDFSYYRQQPVEPTLLDQFLNWIYYTILDNGTGDLTIQVLFYSILLLATVVFILVVFRSELQLPMLWSTGQGKQISFVSDGSEAIRKSFGDLASEAEAAGNFPLMIRFLFLDLINLLNQEGFIRYHVHKTNRDYLQQLNGTSLEEPFRKLVPGVDEVLYSDSPVTQSFCLSIAGEIHSLRSVVLSGNPS